MRAKLALALVLAASLLPLGGPAAAAIEEGFITSFDGTAIHYYLFLPDGAGAPVPLVLRTHGWGGSAESTVGGTLGRLLSEGYGVLTWDQRGFGRSGGQAEIDSPEFEGRDVSALIDQIAVPRTEIAKVGGDPVLGMSGGSYAGGIQFSAASVDSRIDALTPEIAWHDLPHTLFPSNVAKLGWDVLLYGVGQSGYRGYVEQQTFARGMVGTLNPNIHLSFFTSAATNDSSPWHDFYDAHSVRNYLPSVNAPALIIEGTIDTLFSINQGIANYEGLVSRGVDAKLLLYCAGHGICNYTNGIEDAAGNVVQPTARQKADDAIVAWFDRYLKGDLSVDTGPAVEYQTNDGIWRSSHTWPVPGTSIAHASGSALLESVPAPTGGGALIAGNPNQSVGSAQIPVTVPDGAQIVGTPRVRGSVSGAGLGAFVFFKLVNTVTGDVLDQQVSALRVEPLSDAGTAFDIDLEGVAYKLEPGEGVALEISTGSTIYASYRAPALVNVTVDDVSLPIV